MEEEVINPTPDQESASEEKPNKDVSFPRRKEKKGSKKGLVILVIVIVIFIAGAAYYLLTGPSIDESAEQLSPTPDNQVTTTPTIPVEEVIRDEISINVLNGTGISGAAGDLKDELESLGYSNVDVGNASSKGYESTELVFDSEVPNGARDEIRDLLETIYDTVEVSTDDLSDVDIEITTGYPKGHTPTATDAPESTATPTTAITGTITPTASPTSSPTPTP